MATNEKSLNEDELQALTWLNDQFFEKVLRQSERTEDLVVKKITFQPASAKGDNWASAVFRAIVDYRFRNEDHKKSMIIKTMPENEDKRTELPQDSKMFETEIAMYAKVIPKFEEILSSIGDNTQLGIRVIYQALTPKKVIILEDMVPLGYAVLRNRTPSLAEAKAIFTKLAKWHAVSYKVHSEDPNFFDEFRYGHFMAPNLRDVEPYYEGYSNFLELLEANDELQQYKPFFDSCNNKIVGDVVRTFYEARDFPQPDGLYVLCHGDFHYKNLLFKIAPNTLKFEDVMLLDFQACNLGPMAIDIMHATYMMFDANIRAHHLDELYHFFFTTFQGTLRKLNFAGEIPTFLDFRQHLMKHKQYELLLLTISLPMWYAVTEAKIDTEILFFDKEGRKVAWKNPIYVEEVKKLLPKLLHMGYLELE